MENLASLILFFAAGFGISLGLAWLFVQIVARLRKQPVPIPGSILRIRAGSGFYRSHVLDSAGSVWRISAPLQRDAYVPLRVGEEVVIEAAAKNGALLFRTQIVARETD